MLRLEVQAIGLMVCPCLRLSRTYRRPTMIYESADVDLLTGDGRMSGDSIQRRISLEGEATFSLK